jgi:hypothetical protein
MHMVVVGTTAVPVSVVVVVAAAATSEGATITAMAEVVTVTEIIMTAALAKKEGACTSTGVSRSAGVMSRSAGVRETATAAVMGIITIIIIIIIVIATTIGSSRPDYQSAFSRRHRGSARALCLFNIPQLHFYQLQPPAAHNQPSRRGRSMPSSWGGRSL